jgi:hypothetical protein
MKIYTVNYGGKPVKSFTDKAEAAKFMVAFCEVQLNHQKVLALVDEAVLKSDMTESKAIIQHIMEMK